MDFELIVVDDGSIDSTPAILSKFKDERLLVLKNNTNLGVAGSLNRGIATARGKYIARMDADDISFPNRFKIQSEFLNLNPQVMVVASTFYKIDNDNARIGRSVASSSELGTRWSCYFNNPFAHPTVMMRRNFVVKHNLMFSDRYSLCEGLRVFRENC